jgi:hypothetical protein
MTLSLILSLLDQASTAQELVSILDTLTQESITQLTSESM